MAKVPYVYMQTENQSIKLKLGVGALKQLEAKFKKPVIEILNSFGTNLSITDAVESVNTAAQKYQKGFTMKDTENIIDDFIDENENGFMGLIEFMISIFKTAGFDLDAKAEEVEGKEGKN